MPRFKLGLCIRDRQPIDANGIMVVYIMRSNFSALCTHFFAMMDSHGDVPHGYAAISGTPTCWLQIARQLSCVLPNHPPTRHSTEPVSGDENIAGIGRAFR